MELTYTIVCASCKKEATLPRLGKTVRKYCSDKCLMNRYPGNCLHCNKDFMGSRNNIKYCSKQCFGKANTGLVKTKIYTKQGTCVTCNEVFEYSNRVSTVKRYCSNRCLMYRHEVTCLSCGEIFIGRRDRPHCSKKCLGVTLVKLQLGVTRAVYEDVECLNCQTVFSAIKTIGMKYCNNACRGQHQRTWTYERACRGCSATFTSRGSRAEWCPTCAPNTNREANIRRARAGMGVEDFIARDAFKAVLKGDPCCYCGEASEAADHIKPVARGGNDRWDNFTAACERCNSSKGGRELLQHLLVKPIGSR